MCPRLSFKRWLCQTASVLAVVLAALPLHAQKQDEGILAKVNSGKSANEEKFAFDGANKTFGTAAAVGSKQAYVKSFAFGSKTSALGGDGTFHAKAFTNAKEGFRTEAYTTKTSQLSQRNSFAMADRSFGTKSVDVREAPAANRTVDTRGFTLPTRPYEWHGKRQGTLDEIYKDNPNLTIDQVKDLLNKGPVGRP